MGRRKKSSKKGKLWGGLRRAWRGFKIAKANRDKKMREYAEAIHGFQEELGLKKTRFRGLK